jgi:hypothetical protein
MYVDLGFVVRGVPFQAQGIEHGIVPAIVNTIAMCHPPISEGRQLILERMPHRRGGLRHKKLA